MKNIIVIILTTVQKSTFPLFFLLLRCCSKPVGYKFPRDKCFMTSEKEKRNEKQEDNNNSSNKKINIFTLLNNIPTANSSRYFIYKATISSPKRRQYQLQVCGFAKESRRETLFIKAKKKKRTNERKKIKTERNVFAFFFCCFVFSYFFVLHFLQSFARRVVFQNFK